MNSNLFTDGSMAHPWGICCPLLRCWKTFPAPAQVVDMSMEKRSLSSGVQGAAKPMGLEPWKCKPKLAQIAVFSAAHNVSKATYAENMMRYHQLG